MHATSREVALVESALVAIERAVAHGDIRCVGGVAMHEPADDEGAAACALPAAGEPRDQAALHCCLHAASALLNVAQLLMTRPAAPSPQQRVHEWEHIVSHAKAAGRGAYRAALLLADEAA